ncbi:MAG: nitroreductase family protein [Candidatus Aenigmatarchaeota archaeon]
MEFFKVLNQRHSIRKYQDKPIEEEKLKKILEAINSAPSAGNIQAYEVFLIRDKEKKKMLSDAAFGQDFISEAPAVLVFCSNPSRSSLRYSSRGERLYSIQDATIAATFAMLTATDLDLGSCWVGAFDNIEVLKILGKPKGLVPVAILPIGYPAEKPYPTTRRKLEDLVHEM